MSGNELLPCMRSLVWNFRISLSDELMNKIHFCQFLSGELFFSCLSLCVLVCFFFSNYGGFLDTSDLQHTCI